MTKREQVRELLKTVLESNDDRDPIADGDSLLISGRLSSLDVVGLLSSLEKTFGFFMDPNQFDVARFDSVDTITAVLENGQPA